MVVKPIAATGAESIKLYPMSDSDPWSTIRLHQLRDLLAVVETGSLRAAARRLGLTQPSLTKSLRQLEEQTALALFVRSKHGVTLTGAGQRLVEHARSIESEIRRTVEDLDLLRGEAAKSVSIGISMAASLTFIARATETVRRRDPDLQVQIFEGVQAKLIADVRQGVVDFAIMPVGERAQLADLRVRPLFHTRVVVIGRVGHPCGNANSLSELVGCDWITPRRGGVLDRIVERLAASMQLPAFRRPVQCESSSLYYELITRSDLVGLSLAAKLEDNAIAGAAIVFDGPPLPEVPIAIVHRADFPQHAVAGELAECCRGAAASLIARRSSAPRPA